MLGFQGWACWDSLYEWDPLCELVIINSLYEWDLLYGLVVINSLYIKLSDSLFINYTMNLVITWYIPILMNYHYIYIYIYIYVPVQMIERMNKNILLKILFSSEHVGRSCSTLTFSILSLIFSFNPRLGLYPFTQPKI
jgi:hypothetical protein